MGNCNPNAVVTTQIGLYEYKSTHQIGSGPHGIVYKGYDMRNKRKSFAIKSLNKPFSLQEYKNSQKYLNKLHSAHGENILSYVDHYYDEPNSKLYLISDYNTYGNLNDIILDTLRIVPLEDLRTAVGYCQQLIQGLIDLHTQGLIHGGLTPLNILINGTRLVINDIGLSTLVKDHEKVPKKPTIYDAPELTQDYARPTQKSDIWSLGMIMYLLAYKNNPLKIIGKDYYFYNLQEGKCPIFDDLIKKCLMIDPNERISLKEIEEHDFLRLDPYSIEYLPSRWVSAKTPEPTSSHAAYKMFHQMEINFFFLKSTK